MRDVTGKVAFITGGASGMGLAMARSFARAGMKVVIADIEQTALDAITAEFEASNAEFLPLRLDVTDRAAVEDAAAAAEARFEKVHVVCNNAGVVVGGPIDQMAYNDWDWVTGVNIDGVVNGIQTFTERMKAHGEGGHFVNTASMAGHISIPGLSIYMRPSSLWSASPKLCGRICSRTTSASPYSALGWSIPTSSPPPAIGPTSWLAPS